MLGKQHGTRNPYMDATRSGIGLPPNGTVFLRLWTFFRTLARSVQVGRRARLLRLEETLPLGEKRFLAIVHFGNRRFLIAATNQSISLLDRLDSTPANTRDAEAMACSCPLHGIH